MIYVLVIILGIGMNTPGATRGSSSTVQAGFQTEQMCDTALHKVVADAKAFNKEVTIITARCFPQEVKQ
jgi:hypothetical protein